MKLIRKLIKEIFIILVCYYLSSCIDEYTVTTTLQYAFIFIYFFFACNFVCWIIDRRTSCKKISYTLLLAIFMILSLIIINDTRMSYKETSFALIDTRDNQFDEFNSIWISDIIIDGKSISLSDFNLSEGWSYNSEWDDIISNNEKRSPLYLSLPRAESLQIRFVYYDEFLDTSYFIDGKQEILSPNLISDSDDGYTYQLQSNYYERSPIIMVGKYILIIYLLCILFYIFQTLYNTRNRIKEKNISKTINTHKKSINKIRGIKVLASTIAVCLTLDGVSTSNFISILLLILFWFFYSGNNNNKVSAKDRTIVGAFSAIFSVLHLLGSYKNLMLFDGNWLIILLRAGTLFIGWWFVFSKTIEYILSFLDRIHFTKMPYKPEIEIKQGKRIFCLTFFCCLLGWLPYFLIYYPAIITGDTEWQLSQALGISSLSNHQPVIHTLFLRICYNIGISLFHTPNGGMATCTIIQMILMAFVFSYMVFSLYTIKVNKKYLYLCIVFFAIMPFNAFYSITAWKDILFSGLVLIFTIMLWRLRYLEAKKGTFKYILFFLCFIVVGILFSLFRSNGFYAYILCIPFMLILLKEHRKSIIISSLAVIGIISLVKGPVMRNYKVIQPDTIENLSIPIQHIARVIVEEKSLTKEEQELLSQVIDIEKIPENYEEYISDPIKALVREKGNQKFIEEHKKEFFELWLKLGFRYPIEYLKAQIDQTKGYWSTDVQYWVYSTDLNENVEKLGIFRNSLLPPKAANYMYMYTDAYRKIPLYGMFWSIGFYFWIVLLMLLIQIRKGSSILPFIPVLSLVATLMIATPVYAEFRYIYYMIICVPFFIGISCIDQKNNVVT